MVPHDGETSNSQFDSFDGDIEDIFDELEDWAECLEEHEFELRRIIGGPKP